MKKLLLTLLCVGGILGLPGCGGCCRKACEAPCDRNVNDCYEEVMPDGAVKRTCSNGEEVTVYEHGRSEGQHRNYKPVHHGAVDGNQIKFCDRDVEAMITEDMPAEKKSKRARKPARKEMIEDDMMMN